MMTESKEHEDALKISALAASWHTTNLNLQRGPVVLSVEADRHGSCQMRFCLIMDSLDDECQSACRANMSLKQSVKLHMFH